MVCRVILVTAAASAIALGLARAPQQQGKPADDKPNGRYEVDPVHTEVMFKILHQGVSNFYGRFNKTGGKLVLDADDPKESMISLTIDAASVDTNSPDRDKHLKSADFFNVAEHAKITFESEKVAVKDAKHFEVTGTFSMHGVEKEITVPVEMTGFGSFGAFGGTRVGYETKFKIKRSDYKMDYRTDVLADEVEILISLEAARN